MKICVGLCYFQLFLELEGCVRTPFCSNFSMAVFSCVCSFFRSQLKKNSAGSFLEGFWWVYGCDFERVFLKTIFTLTGLENIFFFILSTLLLFMLSMTLFLNPLPPLYCSLAQSNWMLFFRHPCWLSGFFIFSLYRILLFLTLYVNYVLPRKVSVLRKLAVF